MPKTSHLAATTASKAFQHGLTKENNSLVGLNPNLNIEDEYIQNLLKQIHFMNMEVKLLKEKQAQSEGNGLWGIVNRTKQPLVKNIVDSNQKYQQMKKGMDQEMHLVQSQNIRLADKQNALVAKMHYLEGQIEGLRNSRRESLAKGEEKQGRNRQKIGELEERLKQIVGEKEEEMKRQEMLRHQQEALDAEVMKEQFDKRHELGRIRQEEEIEEHFDEERAKAILEIQQKIAGIKERIQADTSFQRAKQDQEMIRQQMEGVLRQISTNEFEVRQLDQAVQLAVGDKEREVLQRKRQVEEYQQMKVVLSEIEEMNGKRIEKEVGQRLRDSQDIMKGQGQTKKLNKHLDDVKKKLGRSEESEKVLRQEMERMEGELSSLQSTRSQLNEELTRLVTQNDKQDTLLSNYRNEFRRVQDQYEKIELADHTASTELNDIESEVVYLRERREYLSEALSLKDTLNQTKLEELQRAVQKNKDMNETVGVLMEQWEEIKKFSKY